MMCTIEQQPSYFRKRAKALAILVRNFFTWLWGGLSASKPSP